MPTMRTTGRPESQYFHINPATGRVTVARDIPDDQLNQPITLVLKVSFFNHNHHSTN